MERIFIFLLFSIVIFQTNAQINPNGIPIKFNAGDWKLVSDDFGMCMLGHDVIAGPILIIEHVNSDIEALKKQLESGYEEEGMQLFPSNSAKVEGNNNVSINYSGNAQGSSIKAKAIGILSNKSYCKGLVILILTETSADDTKQKDAIKKIAQSIEYIKPTDPQNWKSKLNGQKLVDRESHSSSDSSPDGSFYVSVSKNSSSIYSFCSDGTFRYDYSSSSSSSGSGLDSNMDKDSYSEQGQWVIATINNTPMVKFMYTSGLIEYHEISRHESGHYYLNGSQYTKGPSDYCK